MRARVVPKQEFAFKEPFARLDAEFIIAPIRDTEQTLRQHPGGQIGDFVHEKLSSFKKSSDPGKIETYIDITSVDNEDGLTFEQEMRTADLPSRAKYRVKAGDILVSNVRPNRGAISLLSARNSGHLASSGFTLLRLHADANISKEYLFAFLKTEFGRRQLVRRNRGSMYPAVTADDVLDVWVPLPSPSVTAEVEEHVRAALSFQDEFYGFHRQANELLEEFLKPYGAPPSPLETEKPGVNSNVVHSDEVFGPKSALRFDAEFFRQEYEEFDQQCQDLGPTFLLGERYKLATGRSLTGNVGATPYLKQGALTNVGVNWSAVGREKGKIPKGAPRITSGDILLACTAHEIYYVGRKVDLVREVPSKFDGKTTCVADVMVIRPREGYPSELFGSYLAAFLRHPTGLHQVQRCIRGLRGGHVYKSDLAKYVRVPIPPEDWLKGFEALAASAEQARNRAKLEMQRAFAVVHAFIEDLL